MAESYAALGGLFEYLNADCDYATWSQYLLNKLKYVPVGGCGIDIGCGNGYFTRALNKAGYRVDGVDVSPQMLTVAREKAAAEGIRCEFLLGDITKLKVGKRVDFCIAVNDCLNYVPKDKLASAFSHVYAAMKSEGVFLFDISSSRKLRTVIGENLFAEEREDVSYIWFNEQTADGVKMDLTFFIKKPDGLYERREETHIQYAHEEEEVAAALKRAGFNRVESEGHLGSRDKSQRIQFAAYKR